eukprot:6199686-Pleurochrysis_carterae.AAC.4
MRVDRGTELSGFSRGIGGNSQGPAVERSGMRRMSGGEVNQEDLDEASDGETSEAKKASCRGRSAKILLLLALFFQSVDARMLLAMPLLQEVREYRSRQHEMAFASMERPSQPPA